MSVLSRLDRVYRRTGANLPIGGDPLPSHHAEMEGYFWRVTDVANERVLVVLCGVNRHPDGDWATVAIAAEPGGFIRSAVLDGAVSSPKRFSITAGDGAFTADATHVHIDLGHDARADVALDDLVLWPKLLGGGGVFSALPFLGQYWHPHVLGGGADGTAHVGDATWMFDGAQIYAEKNWGKGFPQRWWWGQAQGFDRPDVCVAFGGGALTAGRWSASVSGAVVRVGAHVVRFAPPFARVRCETDGHQWEVTARGHGCRLHLVGKGRGEPHILPVPLPALRRNADTDTEYLCGSVTMEITGRLQYSGRTELAGLEIGHRPPE